MWRPGVESWMASSFNVDRFLDHAEKALGTHFKTRNITRTWKDGGLWIYGNADQMRLSAYWHPTKNHTSAIHKFSILAGGMADNQMVPSELKIAPPKVWVVTFANLGTKGMITPVCWTTGSKGATPA